MALPNSGYLQLGTDGATGRSVNSEFGYGNDMASYLGVYYGKAGSAFRFPVPGNSISMGGSAQPDDAGFYGTSKITSGSATYNSSQTITVPVYNQISITVVGGAGGQAGHYGSGCFGPSTLNWNAGSGGGTSSFGGYVSAGGGSGGGGDATPGNSGSSANSGILTNPVQGGNGPTSGSSIFVTVGAGGSGGNGGANSSSTIYGCAFSGNASGGSSGAGGYVSISWS